MQSTRRDASAKASAKVNSRDAIGKSKIAMDDDNAPRGVVDPEVRAYVYSLVSAVCTSAVEFCYTKLNQRAAWRHRCR